NAQTRERGDRAMEDRPYRDRASNRRRGDRRDLSSDRDFRGASRRGLRSMPFRNRSTKRSSTDLEKRTLRRRRDLDRLPNLAPPAAGDIRLTERTVTSYNLADDVGRYVG